MASLRVCRRTVAHEIFESMQTQRVHLFADLVHVLNVNAKILLSCVASVSARVRPESWENFVAFQAFYSQTLKTGRPEDMFSHRII